MATTLYLPDPGAWPSTLPDTPVTPRDTLNASATSVVDTQASVSAENAPLRVIYGEVRLGPLICTVLPYLQGNVILAVWGHGEVDEIVSMSIDDVEIALGSITTLPTLGKDGTFTGGGTTPINGNVRNYTGKTAQTADTMLIAAFAGQGLTYADNLPGICYSVIYVPTGTSTGFPRINAKIRGLKVWTGAATEWSDNPAYCLADFITNATYGAKRTVDWASVASVAADCNALVGGEKRRTLNLALETVQPVQSWLDTLRTYAGCWITQDGADLKLIADKAGSVVASISHAAGQIKTIGQVKKRGVQSVPTVMSLTYTDTTALPHKPGTVTVYAAGVLAGTTPRRESTVSLPGINRYSQATREATERLNKLTLNDLSMTLGVFDDALSLEVGDIVEVTHPIGFTAKKLRVQSVVGEYGRFELGLLEYDPAVYNDSVATAPTWADTELPDPTLEFADTALALVPFEPGPQGPPGPQGEPGAAGAQGPAGADGVTLYTWIAYADNTTGLNFTTGSGTGRLYIGIANNKTSSTESTNYADYTWSLIKGDAGVPGTPGADGTTTYTWFAYANDATGSSGFTTGAWTNQTYLGIAPNKTTATESANPAEYFWSKIQGATGPQGSTGPQGAAGVRGSVTRYVSGQTSWNDTTANNALPSLPQVIGDTVTMTNGSTYSETKYWGGSSWLAPGVIIDGNLLVSGSVSASKIDSRGLDIKDASGNVIFSSGTGVSSALVYGLGSLATQNTVAAASVTGLGALATQSTVAVGSVTGLGALATQSYATVGSTVKMPDGAVMNTSDFVNRLAKIGTGNISTFIDTAAIGDAYIGNLNASKINAGYISADRIQAGTINADKLSADSINGKNISGAKFSATVGADGGWSYVRSNTKWWADNVDGWVFARDGAGQTFAEMRTGVSRLWMSSWQDCGITFPGISMTSGGLTISQLNVIGTSNVANNAITIPLTRYWASGSYDTLMGTGADAGVQLVSSGSPRVADVPSITTPSGASAFVEMRLSLECALVYGIWHKIDFLVDGGVVASKYFTPPSVNGHAVITHDLTSSAGTHTYGVNLIYYGGSGQICSYIYNFNFTVKATFK